ncbi:STAS domain-containing protein [Streptomyces sp. NPDC059398]|uniref:STAS domain-containing protein n=1 Tax=Streptomyces sp. NPDC059398 TaxID=3346820 RepID=UPI003694101F
MDVTEPLVLVVTGPVGRADVPRLCEELRLLLHGAGAAGRAARAGVPVVDCDVGGVVRPGLAAVEALAGLRLTALRYGSRLRLRNVGPELTELLALTGLTGLAESPEEP